MNFQTTKQTKFIFLILTVALLGGASYGGYRYWQSVKFALGNQQRASEGKEAPAAPAATASVLRESKDTLSKITADKPTEIAVMEDQFLNFYSLEGKLIRSISLKDGAHLKPHTLNPSPDGQRVAFLGGTKSLPQKYKDGTVGIGSGGLPGRDFFVYEKSTNKVSRLTDCPGDFSNKENWYKLDMCYKNFQWGPDSDTFAYVYSSAEKGKSHVGIGKVSTGKKESIYFSGSQSGFPPETGLSPSGQKIFVRDHNLEGILLIDIEGRILKRYARDDFPIMGIETEPYFELYWGSSDDQAFLRISPKVPRKPNQASPPNPPYLLYALDPKDTQNLRRLTPEKEGRTFGRILSEGKDSSGRGSRVAQEHFNPEDEQEHADIAIFNWNGDLIIDSVKKIISDSFGRDVRIPHSPIVKLYKDYVLTQITTEGFVLVNLKDRTVIEMEGERPWYTPGILIP